MVDTDAKIAWQLFHLNWLPIAVMGGLLALGLSVTGLRLEPVAYGITLAIAASLVAIAYRHRIARGDLADPKLIFSLGTTGQVIITCAIVGPLSYVRRALHRRRCRRHCAGGSLDLGREGLSGVDGPRGEQRCEGRIARLAAWPRLELP